ncbi:13612_t:CDS:2, partial [Ambispora gerdemannii]
MTRPNKHTFARWWNLKRGGIQKLEQVATVDLSLSSSEASENKDDINAEILDLIVDDFGMTTTQKLFQKLFEMDNGKKDDENNEEPGMENKQFKKGQETTHFIEEGDFSKSDH